MFPSWIQTWIIVLTNPSITLHYHFPVANKYTREVEGRTHHKIRDVIETFGDGVWTAYTIQTGILKGKKFRIENKGTKQ